uniref:DUF2357 domain-containing protein n=1 Tax=uncultured Armatimonadetes bacterium TaxID=157466 RepID=A0A6J4ITM9_9BACT|nr:hypothetical protein AVDCRST_MAG63-2498 [uncultured Armatimonadetes bacterium]
MTTVAAPPPRPDAAARDSLRDALRSARRWRDLLSDDERRRLLLDIARVALAVGQDLFPERGVNDLDIGVREDGDPCPRERLAFLQGVWPRLARALHAIEAAPHAVLAPRMRPVAPERARRITPMAVLAAVRAGDLTASTSDAALARLLDGRLPRRVAETYAAPCTNTPENRAVKAALAHLARDLAALSALALAVQAPDVAREAAHLRARLRGHLRRAPWRDLPLPDALPALSPTLRSHPHYRLVYDVYRRYRQSFRFDWDNPLFILPARETWLLYEYWGFFQVADALRALGWRAARADGFSLLRSGLTFSLARGQASRIEFSGPDGQTLSLTYNREFPRGRKAGGGGWHSRSHAMRPDVTLETSDRLLVLDPKFKTYARPGWEADDIHQMHAYRDAIACGQARNVVPASWLLYAGQAQSGNRAVIAYPASTPTCPRGGGEVGALLLRPGGVGSDQLKAVIAEFLSASPSPTAERDLSGEGTGG